MSGVHGSSVASEDQETHEPTTPQRVEHVERAPPSFPNSGGVPGWGPWEPWPRAVLPTSQALAPRPSRIRRTAIAAVAFVVVLGALAIGLAVSGPSKTPTSEIASKVDPGVVDVTTNLAYQNAELEGTGMVLSPSGLVLTNNHVIEGASTISVHERDVGSGKRYTATVLGTDVTQDLALLQLKRTSP